MATVSDWDSGAARRKSMPPHGIAQYNPHHFRTDGAIRSLETACVRDGMMIYGRDPKYKFYMRVPGVIVGVCSGEETDYVFAECTSGFVHGRPISTEALRAMGVEL